MGTVATIKINSEKKHGEVMRILEDNTICTWRKFGKPTNIDKVSGIFKENVNIAITSKGMLTWGTDKGEEADLDADSFSGKELEWLLVSMLPDNLLKVKEPAVDKGMNVDVQKLKLGALLVALGLAAYKLKK